MAHHHDCECGHDHHHEHEHESNSVQIDRYHEAFNKFEPALPDTQTTETVNALLEKHFQENFTPEVLKTIHGCIDLTSLTSLDTKENIWKMVDTVNDFEGTRPDVPNFSSISSGSVIYSKSSCSSYGSVVVIMGASSRRAISRLMLLSGIRIPTSFRLRKIFGNRLVPFKIKVNGPGRLCFISLNTLLSTFAYSLILLKS